MQERKTLTSRTVIVALIATGIGFAAGGLIVSRMVSAEAQAKPGYGFAALAGQKTGQDVYGPYQVDPDWPKPLTSLPGHEKWTWGPVESVYAESPNRVFILERGELPNLKRPAEVPYPAVGPSISFPVAAVPWRNASVSPLRAGNPGPWIGKLGVDARWEHCIVVFDSTGKAIEDWTQWDKILKRPHYIGINPYDPEKHVWVVDDQSHAVYEFTNDGKKLVLTLGTPNQPGLDDQHFNRPTFMAWLPDGTMYVTDGYGNSRVVKFDKNGKFLMAWGQPGKAPDEMRPSYFQRVHGIGIDIPSRRIFVDDADDRRVQVFDENGKYLDQWSTGKPSTPQFLYKPADGSIWVADGLTAKIVKFDLEGHLLYEWGSQGDWPGALWNTHGMSVDQEGNLYIAEVNNGRVEKFRPRAGANPDFMVGKHVYSAWK